MYNKYLDAFITAADCGSLAKASELLYISPTAIMKQINQLEKNMGLVLFIRSNKGLLLTEAGKLLYEDAKYMIQYSKESLERAHRLFENHEYYIRIGTSLMNPSTGIAELLQHISSVSSGFQFHIVPFQDYRESYTRVITHLGEQIDVIAGIYGFSSWTKKLHRTLKISEEPVCIAAAQTHPLASRKKEIRIEDLYGESIYITEPGDSDCLDRLRRDIVCYHPSIKLVNMKSFDLTIFNQCESTGYILLTTPMWASLHPMLKVIRVHWDYTVSYGIIYSLQPSDGVQKFIKKAEHYLNTIKIKQKKDNQHSFQ